MGIERVDPYDRPDWGSSRPWPSSSGAAPVEPGALSAVREEITQLDSAIVSLLAERMRLAKSAWQEKRASGVEPYDPAHEAAVVRHAAMKASELGLDPEGVRELFWRVVRMSRELQADATRTDSAMAGTVMAADPEPMHGTTGQ